MLPTKADDYINCDKHPFTGIINVNFNAKISEENWIKPYFNGHPNYEQIENITPGKTYHIYRIEGYGDICEFYLKDDTDTETKLGNFLFTEP